MSLSLTAGNTMDTAHFHLYMHTLVQVARGRWKGGVPCSIALSLVTMETGYGWKQQENKIMGFASLRLVNSAFVILYCLNGHF